MSREVGESLVGTASTVRRWLLVEQAGAWGHDAIGQSGLPVEVAEPLRAATAAAGVRLLLVRSPTRELVEGRRCALVESGPGRPWQRRAVVADPRELVGLDLTSVFEAGGEGFGTPTDDPTLLVCTHGRHDACCADFGRPLVRALTAIGVAGLWESSHLGGDRFAANLVCLPHGLYYGRVTPERATGVIDAYGRGEIDLDHFRGRSCWDTFTQAADVLVRRERGLRGIDDLAPRRRRALGGGVHEVDLAGPAGASGVRARIRARRAEHPRILTCAGDTSAPPTFALIALDELDELGA
ncbi:hypothetical protein BH18ACT1_BH18ACT1_03390 [soil metagenome]